MAAILSRSSRSIGGTYAAVTSLCLPEASAASASHSPLACLKWPSGSACGSSTSSLRARCYHIASSSNTQSRDLQGQPTVNDVSRQSRHGKARLLDGIRRSSTSTPKPSGAQEEPSDAKDQQSNDQTHFCSDGTSMSRTGFNRSSQQAEDQANAHGTSSNSQSGHRRRPSENQSGPRRVTSEPQNGPQREYISTMPRSKRSTKALDPHPGTASGRSHTRRGKNQFGRTASSAVPPPPPYDILFCGTDFFALEILRALHDRKDLWRSLAIITPPDTNQGWGAAQMKVSPVKSWAYEQHLPHCHTSELPLIHEEQHPAFSRFLRKPERALLVTASFGSMIDDETLELFTQRSSSMALNVHPSLLPKLRGAAPIQWTIAKRMSETGATVQQLSSGKFDCGDILAQRKVGVSPNATYDSLLPTMAYLSAQLLLDTLTDLIKCHTNRWKQDDTQATFANKIRKDHFLIDWHKHSAGAIEARWRAFKHLGPLQTYMHTPINTSSRQILLPPAKVLLSDISLVTPDMRHFGATARRLWSNGRPKPGRAWYAHRTQDTPVLICDALSDEERELAKRTSSSPDKDQYVPEVGMRLPPWIPGSEKLPYRELKKLHGGPLPAIQVARIQTDSRPKWPLDAWWKNQLPRRDPSGTMRFGDPETPEQAEERILVNSTKKVKKQRGAEKDGEVAQLDRLESAQHRARMHLTRWEFRNLYKEREREYGSGIEWDSEYDREPDSGNDREGQSRGDTPRTDDAEPQNEKWPF